MSEDVVSKHKVVYIRYSVLDEAGNVMGQQDMPTGYVHGAGSGLFDEIEHSLDGHKVGDRVEAILPAGAFGDRDPELVIEEDLDNVPPQIRYVGAEADLQNDNGDVLTFRVTAIADGRITLDGNSPMAGRVGRCVAEILSIRDASAEEIQSGFPAEQGAPKLH
ncbi:peptidylprolyl isomerase [Parasulfuritortus cantonensis]|uniref:peptidylprolyl isomerase n=1 Tax=Parasulfuritortus cantonensis TaxID=2528202 RepID=A0A4R1BDA3_9PROT|nr:peptidylprolyl isomerase [Parasulfuritortus cantonensis]TCJ15050.1 peptidylprolyl isomerase [Parasulfuritortus cantonensis]